MSCLPVTPSRPRRSQGYPQPLLDRRDCRSMCCVSIAIHMNHMHDRSASVQSRDPCIREQHPNSEVGTPQCMRARGMSAAATRGIGMARRPRICCCTVHACISMHDALPPQLPLLRAATGTAPLMERRRSALVISRSCRHRTARIGFPIRSGPASALRASVVGKEHACRSMSISSQTSQRWAGCSERTVVAVRAWCC